MLNLKSILKDSKSRGWVLEHHAKQIMGEAGLPLAPSVVTTEVKGAKAFFASLGGRAVVAKAISPGILHKSEHGAVVVGIKDETELEFAMAKLLALPDVLGILVEEMVEGLEVMVGSKNDQQFGPVVLLGLGGTAVEVYNDTAIRLAPMAPKAVVSMVDSLTAAPLFRGFRGAHGVNMEALARLVVDFSHLVMELEPWYESIDLNPVICGPKACTIADARIMLFQ